MFLKKSIFALALAGMVFTSCKNNTENKTAETTKETVKTTSALVGKAEKISFTIKGMTCAVMCAAKIEKELAAMDGVQNAKVDFDKETATVEFDNAKQTSETLKTKVESVADGKTYIVSNIQVLTK